MRVATKISLRKDDRKALANLLAADGLDNTAIAMRLDTRRIQVGRWHQRYTEGGLPAIEQDLPRGGRKVSTDYQRIIDLTTQTEPQNAKHWSTRSMAKAANISPATFCACGELTG